MSRCNSPDENQYYGSKLKGKKRYILAGILLMLTMGLSVVKADITEVETSCGLFDCYTILETSFNINPTFIGNTYPSEMLPDTYKHEHIGHIEGLEIEVLSKNSVKVTGTIKGATQNLWGLTVLGDNSFENSTWWNSTFKKCQDIQIKRVANGYTLINFPNYIYLDNSTGNFSEAQGDYSDLRFINCSCNTTDTENATLLNYDLDDYDSTEANLWVQYTLNHDFENISVYWYNNTPISCGENESGTWDSNFFAVYHMNDSSPPDATENDYDLTDGGGATIVSCVVGYGLDCGGTNPNQWIYRQNVGGLTDTITVEHWVYTDSIVDTQNKILNWADGTDNIFDSYLDTNYSIYTYGAGAGELTGYPPYLEDWIYIAYTLNTSTRVQYIDGEEYVYSTNTYNYDNDPADINYCRRFDQYSGNYYLHDGQIDESRISDTVRTAGWINQTYQQIANQGSFITFGENYTYTTTTTAGTTTVGADWYFDVELGEEATRNLMWAIAIIIFILACLSILK